MERLYSKYEILKKIEKAIEQEREYCKRFCALNPGTPAAEREKMSQSVIDGISRIRNEF